MNAPDYNRLIAGHVWSLQDLPTDWAGTKILARADIDGDLALDAEEKKNFPDWVAFSNQVIEFQKQNFLKPDGMLGPATFGRLRLAFDQTEEPDEIIGRFGPLPIRRASRPTDPPEGPRAAGWNYLSRRIASLWNLYGGAITESARVFQLPVEAALAVFSVESGKAYDSKTGLIIIRFEDETVWESKYRYGEIPNRHRDQSDEWTALGAAASIHMDDAIKSASWGLPQIMGFNHRSIGYEQPLDMIRAFQDDVSAQIKGFFQFCRNEKIDDEIQRQDWDHFVRRYNGARPESKKAWVRRIYHDYTRGLADAYQAIETMKKRGFRF